MIEALEAALLAQVEQLMAPLGLKVEPFPDDPDTYQMNHPKGAVLVVFKESTYGAELATDGGVQPRELTYDLVVLIRNLRRHQGAYAVLEALRSGMAGWMAPQASRGAHLVRETFRGREGGVWHWALSVAFPSMSLPGAVPESAPLLKSTSFYEEFP